MMSRIFLSFSFLFLCAGIIGGCHSRVPVPQRSIPEVVVEQVQIRDVPVYLETTGYSEAFEYVNIPARVSGFLREIRFIPGDIVPAGQHLFLIEPDQYINSEKAAEATLASAKAQLLLTETNLARTKRLVLEKTLPQEDLDSDQAKHDEAAAAVLKAEADLAQAKLDLSYTDVRSPIEGKVSRNLIDIGNMVGPSVQSGSTTILTSVAGMNPIYIYFDISDVQFERIHDASPAELSPEARQLQQQLAGIRAAKKKAETQVNPAPPSSQTAESVATKSDSEAIKIPFQIALIKGTEPSKTVYSHTGLIDMADNKIDLSTGTIQIRGEIPNEKYEIYPGRICRVRIPLTTLAKSVVINEEAVMTDMNRKYIFVVDEQSVAHRRDVELGEVQPDSMQVVLKGLKAGEKYVALGTLKARNGKPVKAVANK